MESRSEAKKETFKRVKKHFILMVTIKALGSMLGQIGLWKAGESTLFLIAAVPLLIFMVGRYLINKRLTEERAVKLAKYIPIFYCLLVLAVVGNIMSFLVKIGFFNV
ncbi:MAG: hypothetical protein H0Z40_02345 [Desulfotomaculum sp.]|nr:hypothetical protein [Desulfotomaculum sp.]